jgi:hypothetical protein
MSKIGSIKLFVVIFFVKIKALIFKLKNHRKRNTCSAFLVLVMASESEETWSDESGREEEEDVREILIEKMEEYDPNIFSINFDDLEGNVIRDNGESEFELVSGGLFLFFVEFTWFSFRFGLSFSFVSN